MVVIRAEDKVQHVHSTHQVLVAEDHVLARAVPHVQPTQHARADQEEIRHLHHAQQNLVAEEHVQVSNQINNDGNIITTIDDIPEEDIATNDDKICTEYD